MVGRLTVNPARVRLRAARRPGARRRPRRRPRHGIGACTATACRCGSRRARARRPRDRPGGARAGARPRDPARRSTGRHAARARAGPAGPAHHRARSSSRRATTAARATGDLVLARVVTWPERDREAVARVEHVLGPADDPRVQTEAVIRSHGLPLDFPAPVAVGGAPAAARARPRPTCAIAPTCARCRWSRSTARTPATSTTPCWSSRAGRRLPPDGRRRRRRALRAARTTRSTARRARAAPASTSPIAWCRCCPRRCRTTSAA